MTEYSNTVQLTQGKEVNLVASATETPGVLRRGKPLSMLPPGAYTDSRTLSRQTTTGPAIQRRADEPGNRARRGLSHLRSLSGKPDDSDPLTRRASFLEKVDVIILF